MNNQILVILLVLVLLGGGLGYSTYWRSPGPVPPEGTPVPGWYGGNSGGIVSLLLTVLLIVLVLRMLGVG